MSLGQTTSLGQQLTAELMLMGGAELPLTLHVSGEGRSVSARFSLWSPLAVGVESIQVESPPAQVPLGESASQLAQKLSYLNEPIQVFEVDSLAAQAQLRSNPPKAISDGVEYFEVQLAQSGTISLQRYRNTQDGPRVTTTFTLTLETLERVIDDLAAA